MREITKTEEKSGFSLNLNTLKYIAIIAMTIDHIADSFLPSGTPLTVIMRTIGRTTAPIMFYAAVEGYHHTRNLNKYTFRLATFALISYFPFVFYMSYGDLSNLSFYKFSVIYTILLGILAIRVRREIKSVFIKIPLLLLILFLAIPADWGASGIFFILVFDFYYGNFKNQAFAYSLIVFFKHNLISAVLIPFEFIHKMRDGGLAPGSAPYLIQTAGLLFPLVLLYLYKGEKGKSTKFSKWFFYLYYPAHLLIIGLIKLFLVSRTS